MNCALKMKKTGSMKLLKQKRQGDKGFALVATIIVMSMLMLLSISMLSMSSVSTRNTDVSSHQQIAEANARMAAMIALSQLQEKLGADQRSSATASIMDDGVDKYKKNWTTAWDTSSWDPTDPISTRDDFYLGALVSGYEYSQPGSRSDAESALKTSVSDTDPEWISLVNDGTVVDDEDYVFVPKVEIKNSADKVVGKYAYWVGDEGVKARVNVDSSDEAPLNDWATAGRLASNPGTGVHKIAGMDNYSDYLPGSSSHEDLQKLLTYQTLNRTNMTSSGAGSTTTADIFKTNYHSLTTSHVGLLTDNRHGGIRKDLSIAFEIEPEEFNDIEEFNNSGETNYTAEYSTFGTPGVTTNPLYYHSNTDPELGYLYEIPVDSSNRYRGPTWDLLRNHYRVYKKERNALNFRGLPNPSGDALAAHGVVPFSYSGALNSYVGGSQGATTAGPNIVGTSGGRQSPFVTPHGQTGGTDPGSGKLERFSSKGLTIISLFGAT